MQLVDYEYAIEYFGHRNSTDSWDSASESERKNALTMASNLIWYGFDWASGAFLTDFSGNPVYGDRIRDATCEQALYFLTVNPIVVPKTLTGGIESASAGPASVKFSRDFVAPILLPYAEILIGDLGTARTDLGGIGNAMTQMGA